MALCLCWTLVLSNEGIFQPKTYVHQYERGLKAEHVRMDKHTERKKSSMVQSPESPEYISAMYFSANHRYVETIHFLMLNLYIYVETSHFLMLNLHTYVYSFWNFTFVNVKSLHFLVETLHFFMLKLHISLCWNFTFLYVETLHFFKLKLHISLHWNFTFLYVETSHFFMLKLHISAR